MKIMLAVAACALFSLCACTTTKPTADGSAPATSITDAAGSVATAASDAAVLAASQPGATRDSILSAALTAATNQALVVAPAAVGPGWQEAVRSALALAIVLAKDGEGPPHVDGNKAYTEVDRVVRAKLAK